VNDKDMRANSYTCAPCPTLGAQTGTIIVRQVIGEQEKQKVLDIHVVVPDRKPSIEQIVDVFVKDVEVCNVEVITDKVIVRGEFDIKAIYVADLPDQPVHAVEIKNYKFTQDIEIPGARRGMDADASVLVEFVDYDVDEWTRAYQYKNYENMNCNNPCDDDDDNHCDDHDHDECDDHDHDHCDHDHHHHHHHHICREFDVSVVLKITAKVLADREVVIGTAALPTTPKG